MIRQYIYEPKDAGLRDITEGDITIIADWPSGTLRLDGIEITKNPDEADVFVCPGNIRIFEEKPGSGTLNIHNPISREPQPYLCKLPYFKGNESRHVFFDVSDNFKYPLNLPIMFIRCDQRTWMQSTEPNTVQMAWPVDDYSECIEVAAGGFEADVSFHGWLSTQTRRDASASCINNIQIRCDMACYSDFCGYIYHQPEGIRRRAAFRASMKRSRVALCPESIEGVLPYRFFEAMSAGRVPLLVSSDYVLPFADEIDYKKFAIFMERDQAQYADRLVFDFVSKTPTEDIIAMGLLAREAWVKWLDPRLWPKLHAYAVEKQLAKVAA